MTQGIIWILVPVMQYPVKETYPLDTSMLPMTQVQNTLMDVEYVLYNVERRQYTR